MPTRDIRATRPGPVTLKLDATALELKVVADPACEYGEIIVTSEYASGASADFVEKTTLTVDGTRLEARFPNNAVVGGTVIGRGGVQFNNFGGGTFIAGDLIAGTVIGSVNAGSVHFGNGIVVSPEPIQVNVTIRVPVGSSVSAHTAAGDIILIGQYASVDVSTATGHIEVEAAQVVNAQAMSGGIHVNNVTRQAVLTSMSGGITVYGADSASIAVSTMSGDIRHGANLTSLSVNTMTGRIRPERNTL